MQKTMSRQIAEVLDRHIRGREYGVTRLAAQMNVTPRTIDRWAADESSPSASDLLVLLREVGMHDPERGLRLADELLGLVGLWCYRAPAGAPDADPLSVDALQLAAAAGHVAAVAAEIDADGVRTAEEAARLASATVPVVRHALEVRAEAHATPVAERSFALAGAAL